MTLKKNKNSLKLKAELVLKKTENRENPDLDCVVTFFSLERGIDKREICANFKKI